MSSNIKKDINVYCFWIHSSTRKCQMTLCKEKIIAVRTNDMYDESNI